jgi:hypothetical protein
MDINDFTLLRPKINIEDTRPYIELLLEDGDHIRVTPEYITINYVIGSIAGWQNMDEIKFKSLYPSTYAVWVKHKKRILQLLEEVRERDNGPYMVY